MLFEFDKGEEEEFASNKDGINSICMYMYVCVYLYVHICVCTCVRMCMTYTFQ